MRTNLNIQVRGSCALKNEAEGREREREGYRKSGGYGSVVASCTKYSTSSTSFMVNGDLRPAYIECMDLITAEEDVDDYV